MAHGGLKDAARKIIMEDVFRPLHNKGEWKVGVAGPGLLQGAFYWYYPVHAVKWADMKLDIENIIYGKRILDMVGKS